METESVYGEKWLRWTYESIVGRISLHALVKRKCFSDFYGKRMDSAVSAEKINPFIEKYKLKPDEFQSSPSEFKTFNEFFFRKLKASARPIASEENKIVFPADGRHLGFQDIEDVNYIFAKGQRFNLEELLRDKALAEKYKNGSLILSRLCPVDYHRFHFPASGTAGKSKQINGYLYSVSPIALRQNISIFWENERVITELKTENIGTVLIIEIGATCVGKIKQTYTAGAKVRKGDEKGYFAFGGSSTITIFENNTVKLAEDLVGNTLNGHELYARMGDVMNQTGQPIAGGVPTLLEINKRDEKLLDK
jgi:phosphatidylserine decarboxylase